MTGEYLQRLCARQPSVVSEFRVHHAQAADIDGAPRRRSAVDEGERYAGDALLIKVEHLCVRAARVWGLTSLYPCMVGIAQAKNRRVGRGKGLQVMALRSSDAGVPRGASVGAAPAFAGFGQYRIPDTPGAVCARFCGRPRRYPACRHTNEPPEPPRPFLRRLAAIMSVM